MILVLAQDMVVQVWIPRPCGPFGAYAHIAHMHCVPGFSSLIKCLFFY